MKQPTLPLLLFIFLMLGLPFGLTIGFTSATMPYLMEKLHVASGNIGWYAVLAQIPNFILFVYAPVIDGGQKRKTLILLFSVIAACLFLCLSIISPKTHIHLWFAVLFLISTIVGLIPCCASSLMVVMVSRENMGRVGAISQAGFFIGAGFTPLLTIPLYEKIGTFNVGVILAVCMLLPCIVLAFFAEDERPRRSVRVVWTVALLEIWQLIKTREGWSGLLLFLSPMCTFALSAIATGVMAPLYHLTESQLAFTNGPIATGVTLLGLLVGGFLNDKFPRRLLYLAVGLVTACFVAFIALCPFVAITYVMFTIGYNFFYGVSFATVTAIILETIGKSSQSPSAQYAVLSGALNFAIIYMTKLDTQFQKQLGAASFLWVDALGNLAGVFISAALFFMIRKILATKPRAAS